LRRKRKMRQLLVGIMVLALVFGGWTGVAAEQIEFDLECRQKIAVAMVHGTALGLSEIIRVIPAEKDRIQLIRRFIAPIRFYADHSGYFYVYNLDGVNIAHATQPELQGKNLYDYQDSKGKYVIRELAEKAKAGGGFLRYYWENPLTKKEEKKIGYVEMIPGTNYFIGDGVYLN